MRVLRAMYRAYTGRKCLHVLHCFFLRFTALLPTLKYWTTDDPGRDFFVYPTSEHDPHERAHDDIEAGIGGEFLFKVNYLRLGAVSGTSISTRSRMELADAPWFRLITRALI